MSNIQFHTFPSGSSGGITFISGGLILPPIRRWLHGTLPHISTISSSSGVGPACAAKPSIKYLNNFMFLLAPDSANAQLYLSRKGVKKKLTKKWRRKKKCVRSRTMRCDTAVLEGAGSL